MAPIQNREQSNNVKCDKNEHDEGFSSPSLKTVGPERINVTKSGREEREAGATSSDSDSPDNTAYRQSEIVVKEIPGNVVANSLEAQAVQVKDDVAIKAETLAQFVVLTLIGKKDGKTDDKVEQTLLRCVRMMMKKHEILFRGMMKRIDVSKETCYMTFVAVANELFEGDKLIINWGRIIALYSFGATLALDCKEKNMDDFAVNIASFMGKYASEVVTPFVKKMGGWNSLSEEFPAEDDLESKAWRFLTLTVIGLGVAATASFLTSH